MPFKSKVDISENLVAFSEYINFIFSSHLFGVYFITSHNRTTNTTMIRMFYVFFVFFEDLRFALRSVKIELQQKSRANKLLFANFRSVRPKIVLDRFHSNLNFIGK